MTDFAANVHFRVLPDSAAAGEGIKGGYGWFLGRSPTWESFRSNLAEELSGLGYFVEEILEVREISASSDLHEGEQQELFANLSVYPIQYCTLHVYNDDDH